MNKPALQPVSFKKGRASEPRVNPAYIPGKNHTRFWTEDELAIVRQYYETQGAAKCASLLPKRSLISIYGAAGKLGLQQIERSNFPKELKLRFATPEWDEKIKDRWPGLTGKGDVQALADEFGMPRWWLSKRALRLGLANFTRQKEPKWTASEDALMSRVPLHDLDKCAQIFRDHGFSRTPVAIQVRAKRLDLSRRATRQTYSGTEVAMLLGMDTKTITQWCVLGELVATRRGTKRVIQQGGDVWDVEPEDLCAFIVENIARIDIRKVEKVGFVHLLVDGRKANTNQVTPLSSNYPGNAL